MSKQALLLLISCFSFYPLLLAQISIMNPQDDTASVLYLEGNVILNNVDIYNDDYKLVKLKTGPLPTGIYIIILNEHEGKNVA